MLASGEVSEDEDEMSTSAIGSPKEMGPGDGYTESENNSNRCCA